MSLWVPVVAALGASVLTSLGAWLLEGTRQRAVARAAAADSRRAAYIALVEAANRTLVAGQTLRALLRARSGLAASLAEALRLRQLPDPHEVAWRIADEIRPLLDAQAAVLASGTPKAAHASRELVESATAYLTACTATTRIQRLSMGIVAWTPTRSQEAKAKAQLDRAGSAVKAFIAVAREDLGQMALDISANGWSR